MEVNTCNTSQGRLSSTSLAEARQDRLARKIRTTSAPPPLRTSLQKESPKRTAHCTASSSPNLVLQALQKSSGTKADASQGFGVATAGFEQFERPCFGAFDFGFRVYGLGFRVWG